MKKIFSIVFIFVYVLFSLQASGNFIAVGVAAVAQDAQDAEPEWIGHELMPEDSLVVIDLDNFEKPDGFRSYNNFACVTTGNNREVRAQYWQHARNYSARFNDDDNCGVKLVEWGEFNNKNSYIFLTCVQNPNQTITIKYKNDVYCAVAESKLILKLDENHILNNAPDTDYNLRGGRNNDEIFGTRYLDVVRGGAGDDIIFGKGGNDILAGGDGSDIVFGGQGDDVVRSGNVFIFSPSTEAKDILSGGLGNDEMHGTLDDDFIDGGPGDEVGISIITRLPFPGIRGWGGKDILQGGDGNDFISAKFQDSDNINIYGGNGDDRLVGGYKDDLIFGDSQGPIGAIGSKSSEQVLVDLIKKNNKNVGAAFEEIVRLDTNLVEHKAMKLHLIPRVQPADSIGEDDIFGLAGNDALFGQGGSDHISGGDGNDWIFGGSGGDNRFPENIFGSENDFLGEPIVRGLNGGDGGDRIHGGRQTDFIRGGLGRDVACAGDGKGEIIHGNDNEDFIIAGRLGAGAKKKDAKILYGNTDRDHFWVNNFKLPNNTYINDKLPDADCTAEECIVVRNNNWALLDMSVSTFDFNERPFAFPTKFRGEDFFIHFPDCGIGLEEYGDPAVPGIAGIDDFFEEEAVLACLEQGGLWCNGECKPEAGIACEPF